MQQATDWLRRQIAPTLSNIFLLQRAVAAGGIDPHLLRREIDGAIAKIRLDEPGRTLGFTPDHIHHVRVALITAADEFTQRPGSRCDYSAPPPPGELPLLQQKYFDNRIDLGNRFFDELKAIIDKHSPSSLEHAVLEVFALSISLGVRGMYESYDLDGYEAIRTRLFLKLRPTLALPEGPPVAAPPPWPARPRPSRLILWVAGFTLLFAAALLYTSQREVAANASALRTKLEGLTSQAQP